MFHDQFGRCRALRLRKDDTDLHGKLDKALADMKADGVAAKIAEQWFGKNILK